MLLKEKIILFVSATVLIYSESNIVLISLDEIVIPIVYDKNSTIPIIDSLKQAYLDAINTARSQTQDCGEYGLKPPVSALSWNENLYNAAKTHSDDMAETNTFSHTGSGELSDLVATENHPGEGSILQERIEYAGYTSWSSYGENIAAGYSSLESVIEGWISSPGHCKNLMNPIFREVGMARIDNNNTTYIQYWTQDFGTKQ